jgi:hypothetical protein
MLENDELQAEQLEDDSVLENSEQPEEQASESAPDTGDDLEKTPTDQSVAKDDDPDGFTKRINKKHFELMEEKRAREKLELELQETRSKIPQQQRPAIPDMPDPFDDDFTERMAQRDAALRRAEQFDIAQALAQRQAQSRQVQAAQAAQQEREKSATEYTARAEKLGITPDELRVAGTTVAAYGVPEQVATHILADEYGPLITKYLSQKPDELDALRSMSPVQAGMRLVAIREKAAKLAKNNPRPPDPLEPIGGGGARKERGPKGATFE